MHNILCLYFFDVSKQLQRKRAHIQPITCLIVAVTFMLHLQNRFFMKLVRDSEKSKGN